MEFVAGVLFGVVAILLILFLIIRKIFGGGDSKSFENGILKAFRRD